MSTMSNKTYDVLKLVIIAPTHLCTLILVLSDIFGFGPGAKIAAAVSAIATCLGFYLIDSNKKYNEYKDMVDMENKIIEETME